MGASIRSSLVLALVTCHIVSSKLRIIVSEAASDDVKYPNHKGVTYDIANYETSPPKPSVTTFTFSGSKCYELNSSMKISIVVPNEYTLNKSFNLAFDSGKYSLTTSYDKIVEGIERYNEFCLLWGTWVPSKLNPKKEVDVYFNFITKRADFENKFLYKFEFEEKITIFNTKLMLTYLNREKNVGKPKFTDEAVMIDAQCKEKSKERNEIIINEINYPAQGEGKFSIIVMTNPIDVEGILEFIAPPSSNSKMNRYYSNIWKKLYCDKTKFEFLAEKSPILGEGFKVLI